MQIDYFAQYQANGKRIDAIISPAIARRKQQGLSLVDLAKKVHDSWGIQMQSARTEVEKLEDGRTFVMKPQEKDRNARLSERVSGYLLALGYSPEQATAIIARIAKINPGIRYQAPIPSEERGLRLSMDSAQI